MESLFNKMGCEDNLEKESITYWIKDFRLFEELNLITKNKAFERLYNISFLGAIDYSDKSDLLKIDRNRAVHSLYVAGIANFIATERKYDNELRKHIVAAALLHDIGHIPLSHSVEPYIKDKFGFGHHEIGDMLISGNSWESCGLQKLLSENFDILFIKKLLNNETKNDGQDIFSSKINADTIDGIIRCIEYKGMNQSNHLNRISIAKAFFIKENQINQEKRLNILDDFWKKKHFVYQNYINTKHSIISDNLSQIFFFENQTVKYRDLFSIEPSWKGKYKNLFLWLSNLKIGKIPECIKNHEIEYTTRSYDILKSEHDITKRYINTKEKRKINADSYESYQFVNTKKDERG